MKRNNKILICFGLILLGFLVFILMKKTDQKDFRNRFSHGIPEKESNDPDKDHFRRSNADNEYSRQRAEHGVDSSFITGEWNEIGSNNLAGRTMFTQVDWPTNSLYCISDNGNIWKTDLNTIHWEILNNHFRIPGFRVKLFKLLRFDGVKRLLVSSQDNSNLGFFYSDDEGVTWSQASGLPDVEVGWVIDAVVCNNAQHSIYLAAVDAHIYANSGPSLVKIFKSIDQGTSFTEIACYPWEIYGFEYDLWTDDLGSGLVYMVRKDDFCRIDPNDSIVFLSDCPENEYIQLISGRENENGITLYLAIQTLETTKIYSSLNGGLNWTYKGEESEMYPFCFSSFNCSASNPDILYYGSVDCFKSSNGGVNWERINEWWEYYGSPYDKLHADIPTINPYINPAGEEVTFINTDGGVYRSDDYLETVENISTEGLNISQYYNVLSMRQNPARIFAASQDQGFQVSENVTQQNPVNFTQVSSGDFNQMTSGNNSTGVWFKYSAWSKTIFYLPDINNLSVYYQVDTFPEYMKNDIPSFMINPEDGFSIFFPTDSNYTNYKLFCLKFGNGNFELKPFSNLIENYENIAGMTYSEINPSFWYMVSAGNRVFYSSDKGKSWVSRVVSTDPQFCENMKTIIASKKNTGKIFIGGHNYCNNNPLVFYSDNINSDFVSIAYGLPITQVNDLAISPEDEYLFAATNVGAFAYDFSSETWSDITAMGGPDQIYTSVEFIDALNTARFSTYGRGIFDFKLGPTNVNEIAENSDLIIYPNPNHGVFTIKNKLTGKSQVNLFDGRSVLVYSTFINENENVINLPELPQGIYYISLKNLNKKYSSKMLVIH